MKYNECNFTTRLIQLYSGFRTITSHHSNVWDILQREYKITISVFVYTESKNNVVYCVATHNNDSAELV